MVEDNITRMHHIFDSCVEILNFTEKISELQFTKNRMLHLAIVHLLEIIGESANSITSEMHQKYPTVPWKSIIGMRNRLIHGYFDIDLKVVWQTVKKDIPILHNEIKKIMEQEHIY